MKISHIDEVDGKILRTFLVISRVFNDITPKAGSTI